MYALIALLTTSLFGAEAEAQTLEEVTVARVWSRTDVEEVTLKLVTADGRATREAHDAISLLARPHGIERPSDAEIRAYHEAHPESRRLTEDIPRVHPGLIVRLAIIAERFPDRRIDIVSGYRPRARRTSRHRRARALDIRVVGVAKRRVAELARTLPETGVGYYPNSLFTHIDVREESYHWVDRSGPGQPADYGPWPRQAVAVADSETVPADQADEPSDVAGPRPETQREGSPPTASAAASDSAAATDSATVPVADSATVTVADSATDPATVVLAGTGTSTGTGTGSGPGSAPTGINWDVPFDLPPPERQMTPAEISDLRAKLRRELSRLGE